MEGEKIIMHAPRFSLVSFLCLLFLVVSTQVLAQEQEIEKRRILMETNNDAVVKTIKEAMAAKDYSTIEVKAREISGNMDQLLDLFPKGSVSEKSRAKPEIWDKWDEFTKHRDDVKKAAQELAGAAKARDEEKVKANFKTLGDACTSCHRSFRGPRKGS
jgi:cytochrome c556